MKLLNNSKLRENVPFTSIDMFLELERGQVVTSGGVSCYCKIMLTTPK